MSDAYDRELQQLAMDVGVELGYADFLREGVYCVLGGPSFETIAECRMLHKLGADAVGEYPDEAFTISCHVESGTLHRVLILQNLSTFVLCDQFYLVI